MLKVESINKKHYLTFCLCSLCVFPRATISVFLLCNVDFFSQKNCYFLHEILVRLPRILQLSSSAFLKACGPTKIVIV